MNDESNCVRWIVVQSPDGEAWTVTELDMAAELGASHLLLVGDRYFALGYGFWDDGGGAVAWTSLDGQSWSRLEAASFWDRAIGDIIQTPLGTFAMGFEAPAYSDNTSGFLMWPVQADGSFGNARVIDTDEEPHLISSAIWTGKEFLAWGLRDGPELGPTIVLASPDGKAWTRRAVIPGPADTDVSAIVVAGDRLVAVGHQGNAYPLTPRAWVSDDQGQSWTVGTVDGTDAAMHTLQLENGRFVARGRESYGSNGRILTWVSTDGAAWTLLPDDQDMPSVTGFQARTRATVGDRTCVAGTFYQDEVPRGVIYCRS